MRKSMARTIYALGNTAANDNKLIARYVWAYATAVLFINDGNILVHIDCNWYNRHLENLSNLQPLAEKFLTAPQPVDVEDATENDCHELVTAVAEAIEIHRIRGQMWA